MDMTRTLDWHPRFDERSRAFALAETPKALRNAKWRNGPILDQGPDGASVGFAATANLASTRGQLTFPDGNAVANALYRFAQQVDEWEGEDSGTSVLAGMKALKRHGYISRYEWCFGLYDVLHALAWRGPVQIGVWWHEGMFEPDSDGLIHPAGLKVGGHSVLVSGIDFDEKQVIITNSWGAGWGTDGQARMQFNDLGKLLDDNGEAVVISKVKSSSK